MCHAIQFMPILAIYLNYYPFVISERFEVVYLAVSTRPILPLSIFLLNWRKNGKGCISSHPHRVLTCIVMIASKKGSMSYYVLLSGHNSIHTFTWASFLNALSFLPFPFGAYYNHRHSTIHFIHGSTISNFICTRPQLSPCNAKKDSWGLRAEV